VQALVLLALAGAPVGCSALSNSKTISGTGRPGSTLTGPDGLRITLVRYLPRVRAKRGDVSGLATPRRGTHFAAFLLRECVKTLYLPTLSSNAYSVTLPGGALAAPKFPQDVFADDLGLLGEPGCERGYLVFQVPNGKRPSQLRFALDYSRSDPNGNPSGTKIRFGWTL
jgi:hypothetical protein